MRKKFVLFVLIPLATLFVVTYIFIDRWVEWGLETAGEDLVGAKVEIDNLKVGLSPIGIRFERMQVANPNDPWKNIFETGHVGFALNFGQLLRGKYIIENMEISDLILGTRRTTDGSIPRSRKPQQDTSSFLGSAVKSLEASVHNAPVFDLAQLRKQFNVDSILNVQNLQTLHHLDSLRTAVLQASQQWNAALADIDKSKQRAAQIEANVKAIDINQLKTVENITSAISTVQDAYNGVTEIKQTFDNRQSTITGQITGLANAAAQTDNIVRADIAHVMQLAHLPDLSTKGIAELLLGKEIFSKASRYLYWVEWARTNVPRYLPKPDKDKPRRLKGQDIHFPVERSYPKLWIKTIQVSGGTDKAQDPDFIYAKGVVANVSSDQKISGAPLTVDLSGTQGGSRSLTLRALFDRRTDTPLDEYKAGITGVRMTEFELGQSDFLPSKITGAGLNAEIQVRVPGNTFDSQAKLEFMHLKVVFDTTARNLGERIAREVLGSITGFNAGLRIWNNGSGMDVALSTDLDAQIASKLKSVVGDEIAKLQNDLKSKVEAKIAAQRQEVEKLFAQKRQDVEQQVQTAQSFINDKLAVVNAKKAELATKLDQVKKGALENAVKGIFKKK